MVRTVVALAEEDKAWLDRQARSQRLPMTELIRRAVVLLRERGRPEGESLDDLLMQTSGLWRQGDGLAWQRRLRDEWEP